MPSGRGTRSRPALTALPSLSQTADWASQVTSMSIIRLDANGLVRTWNPGAERILGYRASDVLGSSFERFYRVNERDRHLPARLLERAIREGSAEDTGWRVRADGSTFWAQVLITALRGEDSTVSGFVNVMRDLTADKRQEEQREQFLRAFRHDFLSPITALQGYVDLLEEAAPEHRDLIERVSTISDHLVAMMGELTAHIAGEERGSVEEVALADLVREAGELVLPGAAYDRLEITGERSLRVTTNSAMLRRAIANLVDNAAKYSDGHIRVSMTDAGADVAIAVSDTGRGIAAEDLATIFEPGQRGRLSDPGDGGSGIGLASVRELVERLGGRVELASTVGLGTTITVLLPRA